MGDLALDVRLDAVAALQAATRQFAPSRSPESATC
jgi:hypothetical protein